VEAIGWQDRAVRPAPLPRWQLVLPVKGGPRAKSRLAPVVRRHPQVPTAFALDCLAAVLACEAVSGASVVSADPQVQAAARALGAAVVEESQAGAGLLGAIDDGLRAAEPHRPTAVLLADLPCLLPGDLAGALAAAEAALHAGAAAAMVPDTEGSGTVLLAAARPGLLRPRFGTRSAHVHAAEGAAPVGLDLPRLRRDVDTPAELEQAAALGLGPRTSAALGKGSRTRCAV
jgi:2-phospho-L-lactate guanylyltransferase